MMTKILLVVTLLLWSVTYLFYSAQWASKQEMTQLITQVAEDYQKEQNFDKNCKVWDSTVSFWAVLYALAEQEGGYKDGTVGDRTNNRGSLHSTMGIKKIKGVTSADSTKTRPIYYDPYDGLYEKAHLIATRGIYNKCDIWYQQIRNYVKWPRATINWSDPYMKTLWKNFQRRVKEYQPIYWTDDRFNNEMQINKKKQPPVIIRTHKANCYEQKNKYIQIDTASGEFYKSIDYPDKKLFICNKY